MCKRIVTTLAFILCLSFPIFAASEERVAFTRGGYIFVKDLNGPTKRLVKGAQPAISPDGQTVAFVAIRGDVTKSVSHVKLIDVISGQVRGLPKLDQYESFAPLWSSDGGLLAVQLFIQNKIAFATVELKSAKLHLIPANIKSHYLWVNSWTADGKALVLTDLDYVYKLALTGDVLQKLWIKSFLGDVIISSATRFSFSPDGGFLLFDSAAVPDDVGVASIYLYDLAAARLSRLTSDQLGALHPQWLPSGNEILFTGYAKCRNKRTACNPKYQIYRVSTKGEAPLMLVRNAENATYATW